jgi:hypothetical protein
MDDGPLDRISYLLVFGGAHNHKDTKIFKLIFLISFVSWWLDAIQQHSGRILLHRGRSSQAVDVFP